MSGSATRPSKALGARADADAGDREHRGEHAARLRRGHLREGSTIYTDGLGGYRGLPSRGYTHNATAISKGSDPAHVVLPAVHRVASLLKRWLMGTHHGGIGAQHAEAYLDEFVFRFNRRKSNARGLLFYRLLQNAVIIPKQNYELIVLSRRPQAGKRRGVPKVRSYSTSAITNTPAARGSKTAAASPASAGAVQAPAAPATPVPSSSRPSASVREHGARGPSSEPRYVARVARSWHSPSLPIAQLLRLVQM